jgi:hypothetical protein
MDLPEAETSTSAGRPSSRDGGVRPAAALEQIGPSSRQPGQSGVVRADHVESFSPTVRYGYDPQYGWLRGRLEYSQVDRRWKLRYIPIDGETDDFGGSVVLADTALLSGYERGQWVEVRGSLGETPTDDRSYAPIYRVSQIKRLSD